MGGISGKSDFQDFCEMHHTPEEVLEKYDIYARVDDIIPLKMESKKDLVAYYPYLTSIVCSSKDERGVVKLSDQSYIDGEEQERLDWRIEKLIKYYKKCKRKKRVYDPNEALQEICWVSIDEPQKYEIDLVNRVAELGEKATTEDIYDPWCDKKRRQWYDLMIKNGWAKEIAYRWIYGWRRWVAKLKSKEEKKE